MAAEEPNAPAAENPNDDADMARHSTWPTMIPLWRTPFNQNDDHQVDAGEPNAPAAENPNDDAVMMSSM